MKTATILIHAANVFYGKIGIKLKLYFNLNYPVKFKLCKINKYRLQFLFKIRETTHKVEKTITTLYSFY